MMQRWDRHASRGRLARMIAAGFLLGCFVMAAISRDAVAQSHDYVVVEARAISGPMIGEILSGIDLLTLGEEETVTLVDEAGRKLKIAGPYAGTLADAIAAGLGERSSDVATGAGWNLVASIAGLFSDGGGRSMFRSAVGGAPRMPDPWLIDISRDGVHCVDPVGAPELWRGALFDVSRAVLRNEPTAQEAEVAWPTNLDKATWPIEVSVEDGAQYSIHASGASLPTLVKLKTVPAGLPTRMHAAAWMSDHECKEQARLLVLSADIDHLIGELAKDGKF